MSKISSNNKKTQTPKTSDSDRIDFNHGVPETLYKRAGGRCSFPRCKNPTMGPYYEREGAVNMGTACHIYSAAENGPRGRGGKSSDFISSESNGIWCCQYHGSLIDKSKGVDYPAADLFAWKALAEARALKQLNDSPSPLGWVESIEFTKFPIMETPPKVTLSRRTLIWGEHASGKTSLMEIAASISQSKYAERFVGTVIRDDADTLSPAIFTAKVIYSTVDSLSKELNLKVAGIELTRHDGHIPCLLPPGDLEVIYCSESDLRRMNNEDDIDFMMRVLNVDKSALFALCKIGPSTLIPGEIIFEQSIDDDENLIYQDNGKPYFEMKFKKSTNNFPLPYESLSGSEQGRLILDLLITKAREISKQRLTLLLIESLSINFDSYNFEHLLRELDKEEFQVIVSLPPIHENRILKSDINQHKKLEPLDYLESWRLAIIGK